MKIHNPNDDIGKHIYHDDYGEEYEFRCPLCGRKRRFYQIVEYAYDYGDTHLTQCRLNILLEKISELLENINRKLRESENADICSLRGI